MRRPKSYVTRACLVFSLTMALYVTVIAEFDSVYVAVGHWLDGLLVVAYMAAPLLVMFAVSQYWEGQRREQRQAARQDADDVR